MMYVKAKKDLCPKVFAAEISNFLRNSSHNTQDLQQNCLAEFWFETLPRSKPHIDYIIYKIFGSSTATFMRYELFKLWALCRRLLQKTCIAWKLHISWRLLSNNLKLCIQSSLYKALMEAKFQIKTRQYACAENLECYGKNSLKIQYFGNKDLSAQILFNFFIVHWGLLMAKRWRINFVNTPWCSPVRKKLSLKFFWDKLWKNTIFYK
jgi:hypothetical protein